MSQSQSLPPRPNYENLRKQAKDLHKACQSGDADALEKLRAHHPESALPDFQPTLSAAQLAIARHHGFGSWPRLKRALEDLEAVNREVAQLRADFSGADGAGRRALLAAVHDRRRFVDYADGDSELSEADARLVVANRQDYALWSKYDSYIHLDPAVRDAIAAVRTGDLDALSRLLAEAPEAANPRWVAGYQAYESDGQPRIPNDSIPLFCVSEGVFRGTNKKGNEGELARALLQAGADPDLCWQPMEGAVSFNCPRVVEALVHHGANVEGPAPGVFMAYPMLFGFTEVCEVLGRAGARLDLRFAAGLGHIDEMERWLDGTRGLRPDPGLADPYMRTSADAGESAVRAERTDSTVLSQALLYACLHGRREAALWLLNRGADVNATVCGTDCDTKVLHRMASYAHGETADKEEVVRSRMPMVEWLLQQGADPALPDSVHGGGAVHWAVHSGMIHTMARRMAASMPYQNFGYAEDEGEDDRIVRHLRGEELVEADDVPAVLSYLKNNPDAGGVLLRRAGFCPDADGQLAAALLEAGVDARGSARSDRRLVGGDSSHLHTACSFNAVGVARVLLEAGADPDAATGDLVHGNTPLGFATVFSFPRLVDLLLEYGGTPYNLAMAAATGDLARVKAFFLPDGGLRPDAAAAAILDEPPASPTFDEPQAVVQKAFQTAVLHGRAPVARFLVDKGVDVNATANVEYHGAEWGYLDDPDWAYLGKDPFMGNIWGTLLKHAVARRYDEIADLLRQHGGSVQKPG